MIKNLIVCTVLTVVLAANCALADPTLLQDDFESYSIGTWPSLWAAIWNATDLSTNKVTYDPTDSTNQVLKLYGRQNHSAGAERYCSFPDAVRISAKIYNGTDVRTPGGWGRGAIGLAGVRALLIFRSDGTYATDADGAGILGTYQTERWYDVNIDYIRSGTNLTMTIWLDGTKVLDRTFGIGALEAEATSHRLFLNGGSTAYFDDIAVTVNSLPVADPDGPYLCAADTLITFDGTGSSDPDDDLLTYAWDFGDISTGTGATATHSYDSAGIYDVCLIVNDGIVDSDPACTFAVVYDPSGGFPTGGGWIYSLPGAYVPDRTLEGKASFGFVSKYKKGANVPTGNTEFQFEAGDLNFHISSYDWLVVNQGGSTAQFKGTGTINGIGNYKFMLWAGDDDPDTFRMRIWYEDGEAVEHVVYDNGFDQTLGGGSIVVHTK